MNNMLNEWPIENNDDDDEWTAFYSTEYLLTKPWYNFFWHSKGTVNRRKFDKVQLGMTQEEVGDIMGGPGSVLSDSFTGNGHTVWVKYRGRCGTQRTATFIFYNGYLRIKSQS